MDLSRRHFLRGIGLRTIGLAAGVSAAGPGVLGPMADAAGLRPLQPLSVKKPYQAPEFTGLDGWINSSPLTMKGLRGKVVLVDFWTFGCINCVRTLPWVKDMHEKYARVGLTIVGVHRPEFSYERDIDNVRDAIRERGIEYPVAIDNWAKTWRAYENHVWPAFYFVDKRGLVRHRHFGEKRYTENERALQRLLAEPA